MRSKSNVTSIELKKPTKNGNQLLNELAAVRKITNFNLNRMTEKKREAEAAIDLMSVQYERNCSEEERRNGLLILSAIYGKTENDGTSDSSNSACNQVIDVKIPLQCLIKDSKLILQESGKVTFLVLNFFFR